MMAFRISPHHNVLERARSVNAGLARHGGKLAQAERERFLYIYGRPIFPVELLARRPRGGMGR